MKLNTYIIYNQPRKKMASPETANTEIDPNSPDVTNLLTPSVTPPPPDNQLGMPAYEKMVSWLVSPLSWDSYSISTAMFLTLLISEFWILVELIKTYRIASTHDCLLATA